MAELKIVEALEVEAQDVEMDGVEDVKIRWLISEADGAPNFQMRLFDVGPGGKTPLHTHDWEHEVFVLSGEGKLIFEGEERGFKEGSAVFVPPGKEHSFINTGGSSLQFICLVPTGM